MGVILLFVLSYVMPNYAVYANIGCCSLLRLFRLGILYCIYR